MMSAPCAGDGKSGARRRRGNPTRQAIRGARVRVRRTRPTPRGPCKGLVHSATTFTRRSPMSVRADRMQRPVGTTVHRAGGGIDMAEWAKYALLAGAGYLGWKLFSANQSSAPGYDPYGAPPLGMPTGPGQAPSPGAWILTPQGAMPAQTTIGADGRPSVIVASNPPGNSAPNPTPGGDPRPPDRITDHRTGALPGLGVPSLNFRGDVIGPGGAVLGRAPFSPFSPPPPPPPGGRTSSPMTPRGATVKARG